MILYPSRWFPQAHTLHRFAFPITLFLLMSVFSSAKAAASDDARVSASPMTLTQVVDNLVARNEARARDLKSYEGDRTYDLRYQGFPKDLEARIGVFMKYEAPNTKQFKLVAQSGSKLLIDKVLKRLLKTETDAQQSGVRESMSLDRKNYIFSGLQYQPAANGCSYVLSVEPKKSNKYLYRGQIRVNDHDFAVCEIQAEPAENPSFWIKSTSIQETYEKVGEFWLPKENKSVSKMRFGGSATLTIEYKNYKVQAQPFASADATSPFSSRRK